MPNPIKPKVADIDKPVGNLASSIGSKTDCEDCTNPVCIHNTTDKQRSQLLQEYLNALPVDPLLMPLGENKKPIIKGRCGLDSKEAEELLVTGDEAIERIREGAEGFAIYAEKPYHNTEELVFADHDNTDKFPLDTLPDTLTVMSGSGDGYHETFITDGSVERAQGTGDMKRGGEMRAHNWYVVTPGSIHPSGGIYHTVAKRDLATLSNDLIPSDLQKNSNCSSTAATEVDEEELEDLSVDGDAVDIAFQHLNDWKNENMSAFYCLQDRLNGGRGDYGQEFDKAHGHKINRDVQEKTVLTHLYGIYQGFGYSDSRAKGLANHLLTHYCREKPFTKDGQARKWIKRGVDYKSEQIRQAALQFDREEFRRFENKTTNAETRRKEARNEYSDVTRGIALFAVDLMSGKFREFEPEKVHEYLLPEYGFSLTFDEVKVLLNVAKQARHIYNDIPRVSSDEDTGNQGMYPKKSDVLEICERVDGVYKGNTKGSFNEATKRLQREGILKVAQIKEGEDYRLYPRDLSDPPEAELIRHKGETYEPE